MRDSILKINDTVEIIGNIPFQLRNKPKPLLGIITRIDGLYILVRPKNHSYECEFYPNELNKIYNGKNNNTKARVLSS